MTILGRHHIFGRASRGAISCAACGVTYTEGTMWRAEVDPCVDGRPTGVSEAEAMQRARAAINEAFSLPAE